MSEPIVDWSEVRAKARTIIQEGYDPVPRIEEDLLDCFELEVVPHIRAKIHQLVQEELREHEQDQNTWPTETDCDRLDLAFAQLEAVGILARQNFSCCSNCGNFEIRQEIAELQAQGRSLAGYAYFHFQDTESAVEEGRLYLAYGPSGFSATEEAVIEIGRIVATSLRNAGLRVEWDENPAKRLCVAMNWQRRRPPTGAV